MQSRMRPSCVFIVFLSLCVGWPAVHGETLHGNVQMQVENFGDMLDAKSRGAEVGHGSQVSNAGKKTVQVEAGITGHFIHRAGSRHAHGKEEHHASSKSKFATLMRHLFGAAVRKTSKRAIRAANPSTVIRRVQKQMSKTVEATSKVTNQSAVIRRAPKRNQTVDMASKVTNQSTVIRRARKQNLTVDMGSKVTNQSMVIRRAPKRNQTVDMASKITNQSAVIRRAPKQNQTVDMASKGTNQSMVIRRAPRRSQTVQVAVGGSGHTLPNVPGSAGNATHDMTAAHRGHAKNRSVQFAVESTGAGHDDSEAPESEEKASQSAVGEDDMQHLQVIRPVDLQRDGFAQAVAGAVQDTKHRHGGRIMRRARDHRRNGQVALGTD